MEDIILNIYFLLQKKVVFIYIFDNYQEKFDLAYYRKVFKISKLSYSDF